MSARRMLHPHDAAAVADIANALQAVAPLADRIRRAMMDLTGDCTMLDAKVTDAVRAIRLLQPAEQKKGSSPR